MKLALVSPYDFAYPGGVTEHVSHLAEQFLARGHEVHYFTLNFTNVGAIPPPGSSTNSWTLGASGKWETASNWS